MVELYEKKVLDYFSGDFNCAQSVLRTILEEKNVYFDEATYVASAFGGGIIGRGEICGAVSGALMAIGVLNGILIKDVQKQKDATREDSLLFYKKFEEIFEHNTCNGLIGIDRNDPGALEKARDEGRFKQMCPKFVVEAVKIVLRIFEEKEKK